MTARVYALSFTAPRCVSAQQSLANGDELLLRARNEKDQAEHELRLLRLRCLALEDSLNECNIALVAARASAAASSRLLHPSPRAAPFFGPSHLGFAFAASAAAIFISAFDDGPGLGATGARCPCLATESDARCGESSLSECR